MKRYVYLLFIFMPFILCRQPAFCQTPSSKFELIAKEIEDIYYSEGTRAKVLLNELYQVAYDHREQLLLYVKCLYYEALINNGQGVNDSILIERLNAQTTHLRRKENSFENVLCNYALALSYATKNDYGKSFSLALYAYEQFRKMDDKIFMQKTLSLLGNICTSVRNHEMAKEYFEQSLHYLSPDDMNYYLIQVNIHLLNAFMNGRIQPALDSISLLTEAIEGFKEPGTLVALYLNIGGGHLQLNDTEKAFEYYIKSLEHIQSVDNKKLVCVLYHNLGLYYERTNNLDSAYVYYNEARNMAVSCDNPERLSYTLLSISNVYEAKGNIDSAYFYLNQYKSLNEKIVNNSKIIESYKAYVSILLESSEKEIAIKGQQILMKNRTLLAVGLGSIGAILLIILLLIIIRQKKGKEQLLQKNLESKIREVTSYSLLISSKNNILQQISYLTKKIPGKSKELEEVDHIIKNNLNAEQDWEHFMLHFEQVHPDFFSQLKKHCGDLTKINLRLCAYIRVGVSTKEISQILNVSPGTIKISKYRLKKKLGLSEEDNLDDFITSI